MTRYLMLLRMCQKLGHRIGPISDGGSTAIAYIVDGYHFRFRHGYFLIACHHGKHTIEDWTKG